MILLLGTILVSFGEVFLSIWEGFGYHLGEASERYFGNVPYAFCSFAAGLSQHFGKDFRVLCSFGSLVFFSASQCIPFSHSHRPIDQPLSNPRAPLNPSLIHAGYDSARALEGPECLGIGSVGPVGSRKLMYTNDTSKTTSIPTIPRVPHP